jgi:hypothetical protein
LSHGIEIEDRGGHVGKGLFGQPCDFRQGFFERGVSGNQLEDPLLTLKQRLWAEEPTLERF